MHIFSKKIIEEEKKKDFYNFITRGFKVIKLDDHNTIDISIHKHEIKILFISDFTRQPIARAILSNINNDVETEIINYNLTAINLNDNLVTQDFPESLIKLYSFKLAAYESLLTTAKIFQSKSEYISRLKMEDLKIKIDRNSKIKKLEEKEKIEWCKDPNVIDSVGANRLLLNTKKDMINNNKKIGFLDFINSKSIPVYYKLINRDNRFEVYYSIDSGKSFPYKRITQNMFINMIENHKLKKALYQ